MRPWIDANGLIQFHFPIIDLAIKNGLGLVPNLNTLDCLVVLADALDVPEDHISTAVIRFLFPDFHDTDAVSRLERCPVVFILVGIHIFKALGNAANKQFIQFSGKGFIFVEICVKFRLQFRIVRFHKTVLPGKHILRLLIGKQLEEGMTDSNIAFCFIFLKRSICIKEENPIVIDIMIAFIIPQADLRKPLFGACCIAIYKLFNFACSKHLAFLQYVPYFSA